MNSLLTSTATKFITVYNSSCNQHETHGLNYKILKIINNIHQD